MRQTKRTGRATRLWGRVCSAAVATAVAVAAWSEPIELAPRFEVGEVRNQQVTMNQDIRQSFMGQPMNMSMDVVFDIATTVDAVSPEGVYTLTMKYERVAAEVEGPMGPGRWETGEAPPANPMLAGFAALDGMALSYDLDPLGKASKVHGTDALLEKALQGVPEPMRPMMREMLQEQFSEEQMAAMINVGGVMYPQAPVEVGETWSHTMELGGMMPLDVEVAFTLTDADDETATADMAGSMSTPDDATMKMGPGMEAEMSLEGKQAGTIVFERASGWVRSMKMQQDINGELTVANPGDPNAAPMNIPMKMNISIQIETMN